MSDFLNSKQRQAENKNNLGNLFAGMPGSMFALGGDIQTNGADFTTGMTHVNAGGSHEENPNEGIQMGVDPQGTPNLVEENETVYNDYVYSNRIFADGGTLKKFHLPKKAKLTYADITKKLEKEIKERPNDPISKAAFKAQMEDLANEQERQKQEMEAERAREAFEALSPEEQVEVMQYAQQQEQAQQEAAMQEQAMAEQQAAAQQQPTGQMIPEEAAMTEQEEMSEPNMRQEPVMAAEGGKINTFAGTQNGSNRMKNAGDFKTGDRATNWNTYTRGGLRDYLQSIINRINLAPDEQTKNAIRQEAINTVAGIQKAYSAAYQNELSPVTERDEVKTLQELFNAPGGNKYFTDIANNINVPYGADTGDRADRGWVDSLWGPRTSIRNWGSTEYGDADYYKDLADLATQAGMVYAPNADWTYDNNTLYGLSIPGAQAQVATPVNGPVASTTSNPNPNMDNTSVPGRYGNMPWAPEAQTENVGSSGSNGNTPASTPAASKPAKEVDKWDVDPVYRNEKLRYAGLIGPAVGLGMQALGIGRPDTKALDGVLEGYDRTGAALADYKPIGDYLRYSPMDIWAEQNRLNANTRATDRALANNSAPIGTRAAGLLANEYNNQIGSGELYRKALEYNDALRERTATFNRGTNQFNAEAYNRAALQNAEIRNRDRQLRAQLGMQAAAQKADMDAGWYNGIYGNVAGLFKGIGDLGRENAQHNMIAEMAADGIFGTMSPQTNTGKRGKYLTWKKKNTNACGGKLNKGRRK